MPATIRTTLVDNSKEWADELRKRFLSAGGSADQFEDHLRAVNKELESRAAKAAAAEIKDLADALDGTAAKADALQAKLANQRTWADFGAQWNVVTSTLRGAKEALDKVAQGVRFLADQGVPAFQKLEEAGTQALNKIVEAASDPRIEKGLSVVTAAINGPVSNAIENLGDIVGNLGEIAYVATDKLSGLAGVDFSQQVADAKAMTAELAKIKQEQTELRTIEMRRREAVAMDEKRHADDMRERRQADIALIDNEQRAQREYEKSEKVYNEARKKMQTADDNTYRHFKQQAEQALEDMRQLERRRLDLHDEANAERIEKERQAHNEMVKFHEQEFERYIQLEDAKLAKERQVYAAHQAELTKWQQTQQAAVDRLAQAFGDGPQQGGQGGQGGNVIGQIKSGITDKAKFDQIVKQRQHDALQSWRDKQTLGKRNFAGELIDPEADPNDPSTFLGRKDGTGGPQAYAKKLQREREQIERQTRMRAFRDMKRGKLSQTEVADAEGALVNNTADLLEQGGQLNTNAATAIKQLANQAARQAQDTAQANDLLRSVLDQLANLTGRRSNATQRAQRQF